MRLVVGLGPNVSIRSHSEDMTLAYHNERGHKQSVTYCWIGGITTTKATCASGGLNLNVECAREPDCI